MAIFRTLHTTLGLAAMAQAEATGTPVTLTEMAVGDGNGNPVTPTESQTTLVRELFRATINRVFQSPTEPNRFTAELVIPASTGGFVLREVGVFDADGSLFAVGNLPDTYKPVDSEGAFADTVVRLEFMVTNADVVTLQIDPNVAVATQQWISNHVTAAFMIPGGTTHQILRKASNADGDTEWADPTDANVVVDTVEEQQTLAAAQTVVILTTCTTYGLSVYIEGVRLRSDQWTPDGVDETKFTLATSYPAGSKLTAVQNEPAGSAPAPLVKSLNLADVPNKATARTNLDVYSKAEADQKAPAGAVVHFARNTAPTGWLKANGAAVSRTAYAALFAAIGTTFGAGDGFNTFNLPDLRGEFLRGWDDGRGVDTGRTFGGAQDSQNKSHAHTGTTDGVGDHDHGVTIPAFAYGGGGSLGLDRNSNNQGPQTYTTSPAGAHSHTFTTNADGGSEARPRSIALLACIKF